MNDDEVAAVWVGIGSLTPWDKNPRKNAAAISEVAESIKRFGFASPIIARKADSMVIAGHTRLEAAKRLGLDRVPVRFVDLDPADARLLALVDNKVGEIAEWDDDKLQQILSEIDADEWLAKIGLVLESDSTVDDFDDLGDVGEIGYSVTVECADEHDQRELLEELEARGLKCRALMS